MCGIAGIVSKTPVEDRSDLVKMRETMFHRGPDDGGEHWALDDRVGLAHRRLSIIDLSEKGHQPMTRGKLTITYNGEIYNYQQLRQDLESRGHNFTSATDTEVILRAYQEWGNHAVEHLNGMFAFCILDNDTKRLFLARDRAGEKPLFYMHQQSLFLFASELKALMAHPSVTRVLELNSLIDYLTYGYVSADRCILQGIRKLPPAHAMTIELESGRLDCWKYWSLPDPSPSPAADADDLVQQLEELLADSIALRLVADVPVGILLSGGLDSSIVTALAARVTSKQLKTFTVAFPGAGAFDETVHARQIADHFGTEHTVLEASQQDVGLLTQLARQYDEPLGDPSMVPTYMISREIRQHATVALGGDGGDELFAGYLHYSWLASQKRIRRMLPDFLRSPMSALAGRCLPVGFQGRNQLLGISGDMPNCIAHIHLYFDRLSRQSLLSPDALSLLREQPQPEDERRAHAASRMLTPLYSASSADFSYYLPDDVLTKVDRASMLTSLEVRAPMLDTRLIEFAFSNLPDKLRATAYDRKILLKQLGKRLLPETFDVQRKQGFSVPPSWFSQGWGTFMNEVLQSVSPKLFNLKSIQALQEGQQRGRRNTERIFALVLFELWRDTYNVELPV